MKSYKERMQFMADAMDRMTLQIEQVNVKLQDAAKDRRVGSCLFLFQEAVHAPSGASKN